MQQEVNLLRRLRHPGIVQLLDVVDEKTERHAQLHLILEFAAGGELYDRIEERGSYSEADAARTLRELCGALEFMHGRYVVHRDIKPENILYADRSEAAQVKLADFGLARELWPSDVSTTACGTPAYTAPEVISREGYAGGALDIWSVGVVLYVLLCGSPPFDADELPELFSQILSAEVRFPERQWEGVSDDARDIVRLMLQREPRRRPTAPELLARKWVAPGGAPTVELPAAMPRREALKRYNACRKLRRAVHGAIGPPLARAIEGLLPDGCCSSRRNVGGDGGRFPKFEPVPYGGGGA